MAGPGGSGRIRRKVIPPTRVAREDVRRARAPTSSRPTPSRRVTRELRGRSGRSGKSVSYTHLTLPTIYSV